MAKAGMRRPDFRAPHGTESNHITHLNKNKGGAVEQNKSPRSKTAGNVQNIPTEIQGKAKTHKKANPTV